MLSALLFTHFMVRVLIHPTLMPFICSSRISTFFSPLHCSQHAAPISLSTHPVCYAFRTGLTGCLCSPFFYYSRCCTLLTRLASSLPFFPPLFFVIYLSENLLGLSVYRAVIVKAILPLFLHPNTNSLTTSDFAFPLPFYCSLLSLDCSLAHRS